MHEEEAVESPRKRLKLDDSQTKDNDVVIPANSNIGSSSSSAAQTSSREIDVGITEFVSRDIPGFEGILKKRYTDFLVNEILPSGEVLHLQNLSVPPSLQLNSAKNTHSEQKVETADTAIIQDEPPAAEVTMNTPEPKLEFTLSVEDRTQLEELFGQETASKIMDFHSRVLASPNQPPKKFGRIEAGVVDDKETRTKMHMTLRRVFSSLLESRTDADNIMVITAAPNRHKKSASGFRGEPSQRSARAAAGWEERGGKHLHFTIYKENKDTMEVVGFLARALKMNAKGFQFAGTKDRRGVTVQRACVFKVAAERLTGLNRTLRNAAVGDFEYKRHGLDLGDLDGNEFVITLRDCQFLDATGQRRRSVSVDEVRQFVGQAMYNLRERGYMNYYGMQRFGTYAIGTHEIGIKMLQGDFKGAVDALLHVSPHVLAAAQDANNEALISSDDRARAEAINIFRTTGNINNALEILPRKFSAETSIIRFLSRGNNDYFGALQSIPRNLRLMYVHAYQSFIWNLAAGERWRLFGDNVVEGDLVICDQTKNSSPQGIVAVADADGGGGMVDADGEIIVEAQAQDRASTVNEVFIRARPLSAEEAASGNYSIFDVVLPLPGYDIVYPANQMTNYYKTLMASERAGGLDPFDMRRKWKDVSLSGSYRKILSRPGPVYSYQVHAYSREDAQFVSTDMDRLKGVNKETTNVNDDDSSNEAGTETKLAVVLKFQLGSSQYATMALRELMKSGGLKEFKPDFGGGR